MKTQSFRRIASGIAAAAVVVAGAAITAAPAHAATVGTLLFGPATGVANATATDIYTSGICSNASDTMKVTVIGGSGTGAVLTQAKNLIGAAAASGLTTAGTGYHLTGTNTWSTFAQTNSLTVLNGAYTVSAVCSVSGDHYDGVVTFTGTNSTSATYVATTTTAVATTTTLSPATSTVGFGSAATVTATVAGGPSVVGVNPTGSVQFLVDGSNSGAPVALTGTTAAFTTPTNLASGIHSITAVFTPDTTAAANGFVSSTSTGVSVTVNKTTPTVTVSDNTTGTQNAGAATTLTATITPSSLAGTVTFTAGGTTLGTATVSAGTASYVWNISPGQATGATTISAQFTPTDIVNVSTPAAATETFTVAAALGINTSGTVTVVLPTGTLTLTAPAAMTLTLANPVLSSNGKYFIAAGAATPVTVYDTRAGDFGWNLKVASTDFVGTKGGVSFVAPTKYPWQVDVINAADLGFTADSVVAPVGETLNTGVTASDPTVAANGLIANVLLPNTASTTGLNAQRQVVFGQGGTGGALGNAGTTTGSATGHAIFLGSLVLNIPTVTVADTYTSTLTYTLSSN